MKASDYRQHAQYCRDLAKHTLPGEFCEQLLEIAKTWDTLAVEEPERVQQPGGHRNEDAPGGFFASRMETRTPLALPRDLEA